jgi:hypothetical protein
MTALEALMTTMTFVLDGNSAAAAEAEFRAVLRTFEPGIEVNVQEQAALPETARKAIDPISLAALIVSIPSAVLAVLDLADRIEKRRRAQKLIEEAKRLHAEREVVVFVMDREIAKPLDDLEPDDLLDVAQSAR